ncbi:MAG: FAD-dependent oxidoreductase, partial [Desulfobacterales bacterium]
NVHLIEPSPIFGNGGNTPTPGYRLNARMLEAAKHQGITMWTHTRLRRTKRQPQSLQVQLQQDPRYVDLAKCTGCGDCVEVCPVTVPGSDRKAISLMGGIQPGCAAIEKLGQAPCAGACPGGIHAQGYIAFIAQGRFQEALDLIREAIPFPGILGRICTHPCELNCRRSEVDTPVSIRLLKRFVADWELDHCTEPQAERITENPVSPNAAKVAVVGSGPAGMTVADRLVRWGYRVTVFEKLPVIAGMLSVGIPAYRLPRKVIEREYRRIEARGIEIRLNTAIGAGGDHSLDDLFKMGYEAICLAIGAHQSLSLRIPGEDLRGVVQGIALLKTINLNQRFDAAKYEAALKRMLSHGEKTRAVVLGGGNTAMDVARTLKRVGVQDVCIAYRRSRDEMPALKEEIDDTEREGVAIEYLTAPIRIIGDAEGHVTGLECIRMQLGEPDKSGRRRPVPISGSEFAIPAELVVPAIGQVPDIKSLDPEDHIRMTRDQRIEVMPDTFATHRPGVFTAGDAMSRDQMSAIEAIGMGKKAAVEIDAYLRGLAPAADASGVSKIPVANREMSETELLPKPHVPVPSLSMEKRLGSFAEIELGYSREQAIAEARRCLTCGPCSECLACVQACGPGAIVHQKQASLINLEVGAIIYADQDTPVPNDLLENAKRIYRVSPEDSLMGSAAAAHIMSRLTPRRPPEAAETIGAPRVDGGRMGVFICNCDHLISDIIDTEALCEQAATWPDVAHAQVLPFSCTPDARKTIQNKVRQLDLNRITLGACACCSLDQVCYSCTYQRVRCKANLGLFHSFQGSSQHQDVSRAVDLPPPAIEFVNIREQCAWAHRNNPRAATAKATAMVAAAAAKNRSADDKLLECLPAEHSVMIFGSGLAARTCRDLLRQQDIAVHDLAEPPSRIRRVQGCYSITQYGRNWKAAGMVLAPGDATEADKLMGAFGDPPYRPRFRSFQRDRLETTRPGVFYCDPALEGTTVGAAATARVSAWLGQSFKTPGPHTA